MVRLETITTNQTIVYEGAKATFFSYDTPICSVEQGKTILYPAWQYSKTTSKYRNQFLGETTKETQKHLDSGNYTLENSYA